MIPVNARLVLFCLFCFELGSALSGCGSVSSADQTDAQGAAGAAGGDGAVAPDATGAAGTGGQGGSGGDVAGAGGQLGGAGGGGAIAVDPNRTTYGYNQIAVVACVANAPCGNGICTWEPSPYVAAGQDCADCPPHNTAVQLVGQLSARQAESSVTEPQRSGCQLTDVSISRPPNCVLACP